MHLQSRRCGSSWPLPKKAKRMPRKWAASRIRRARDADAALFVEAARPSGEWVHRNYMAK